MHAHCRRRLRRLPFPFAANVVPVIIPIPGFSEPFNSLSHLFGLIVFGCVGPFLVRRGRGLPGRVICLLVLVIATEVLLAASMIYHMLEPGTFAREAVMRRIDHAAIFILIAGSLTTAHGILFTGWQRSAVIACIWLFIAIVVPLKMVYWQRLSEGAGLVLFLCFGWLGLISGALLYRRHGARFVLPIIYGGIAYSLGALSEFARWPQLLPSVIGPHGLFHLAVLLGLGLHWWFFWRIADQTFEPEIRSRQ